MTASDPPLGRIGVPADSRPDGHPPPWTGGSPSAQPHRFTVQRIPPSHDYIRRRGTGPEDAPGTSPGTPPDASPFVHLHVHSNFSFLDGGSRIEELVDRAAELGQPALALTDHDGLYGIVRFAKACARRGIQAILGAEVRVEPLAPAAMAAESANGKSGPGSPAPSLATTDHLYHLVLLAETRE